MRLSAVVALAAAGVALSASGVVAQNAPRPQPCSAAENRQFDFWVGDWIVEDSSGNHMGDNNVTLDLGRCVLTEHWTGSRGGNGMSFNAWDGRRRVWHQTWVDNSGSVLLLDGQFDGTSMVLSSAPTTVGGGSPQQISRITWTPLPDGRVRQHWQTSTDGGTTWTSAFNGLYRKRAA